MAKVYKFRKERYLGISFIVPEYNWYDEIVVFEKFQELTPFLLDDDSLPYGSQTSLTDEDIEKLLKELKGGNQVHYPWSDPPITSEECSHDWKHYEGFSEVYDYCIYCDIRKDDKCYE